MEEARHQRSQQADPHAYGSSSCVDYRTLVREFRDGHRRGADSALSGVGIAGFLSNDKPAEDQANPMQIRMKQFDDLAPKTQKSE